MSVQVRHRRRFWSQARREWASLIAFVGLCVVTFWGGTVAMASLGT